MAVDGFLSEYSVLRSLVVMIYIRLCKSLLLLDASLSLLQPLYIPFHRASAICFDMAFRSSVLVSFLLASTALALPTANGRSTLPWSTLRKRQSGGSVGVAYNGDGGWLVTTNIGGQDVTSNIDTGSSDL